MLQYHTSNTPAISFWSDAKYCLRINQSIKSITRLKECLSTGRRWRFGLLGNVVGRINEVNQRRARLVLGWVTVFKTGKPSLYVTSHPGQLSLAIPPRVGKMSTGDDSPGKKRGVLRNSRPCTSTAGILTQSVIWRTWAVC